MSDIPIRSIDYPGPPTHGSYNEDDISIDSNGILWKCLTPGSASGGGSATFASASTSSPVGAGAPLVTVQYAPATVDTSTTIISSTGLTAIYFATNAAELPVTFKATTSNVLWKMQALVKGGAAAASSTIFGIVSQIHTSSPGTVVGVLGLPQVTPTATAADNVTLCTMTQKVAVTPGTSYTWYGAAMYSGTATTILAQGTTSQTTVPTGAPYIVEVWPA